MKLSIFSNILDIFKNLNYSLISFMVVVFLITVVLMVVKSIIFKRINFISLFLEIILLGCSLLFTNIYKFLDIIFLALYIIILFNVGMSLVLKVMKRHVTESKVKDYLKNAEFDYFFSINNHLRLIDASENILELTNHNVLNMKKLKFPIFLFDYFHVCDFNGESIDDFDYKEFSKNLKKTRSKYKKYEFTFTSVDEVGKKNIYFGLMEPVYFGGKLISRNIYLSIDKENLVKDTKAGLIAACTEIEALRNQVYVLMSLSSGVLMYYDFSSKRYIPTQSFLQFTNSNQLEYDFNQYMSMIHPEDLATYIDQSQTINTVNSIRLKYRLLVADKYYNVFEDSIYLENQDKLVSIIRICNSLEEGLEKKSVLSTDEAKGLMNELSDSNISNTLDKTLELLKGLKNE